MKTFFLLFIFLTSLFIHANSETISFSGRLVEPNGVPIVGPVELEFKILVNEGTMVEKCSLTKVGVPLSNGVFNVTLDYGTTCLGNTKKLSEIIEAAYYSNYVPYIRTIDNSHGMTYQDQPIRAVPLAVHALTGGNGNYNLDLQYPCSAGQILKMDGTGHFACDTDDAGSGAVTTVNTGTGLTGGPITSVGTISIAAGGVDSTEIASSAITTAKIADSNVTTAKIADSNVTTAKIADSNVTTAKIADSNVTTAKIADSNVTTAKIADGAITATKLATGAISSTSLADDSVTTAKIKDGEIVNADISNTAAIAYSKLSIANSDLTIAKTSGLQSALDGKLPLAGGTLSGDISLNGNDLLGASTLSMAGATSGVLTLSPTSIVTDYTLTFPANAGSSGQVLATDGSGTTSWMTVNTSNADGNSLDAADGTPTNALLVDNDGSIGINTSSPDASSILEMTSTTKGFLGPRMSTTERNAIASPATGLQIYNTTTSAINFYDGSSWKALGVAGSGVTSVSSGTGLTGGPITGVGTLSIAAGGVSATELATDAVTTVKITDANVTAAKLANDSVTTAKIVDANVTTAKLADDSVTTAKLATGAIDTTALADNAVTSAKIIDGEIVNADISNTAAIAYSKISIADSDLTIAKTSGLQTALDAKLPLAGGTMSGDITMSDNDILGLKTLGLDGTTTGTLTLSPASAVTDYTLTFPATAGSNGQALITDGLGTTSWSTVNTSNADGHSLDAADGTPTDVVYVDNDGEVGIGLTNPTSKLHVDGGVTVTTGNDICIAGGNCLSAAGTGSGDMTSVNTNSGSGLSGGATSGDATLQVVVDDSTVEIATNTIQVKDSGITSAKIADGEIVNADISGTAAITYSKLSIADSDLTIAKTSGLQTALDAKLPLAGGTMTGDITMSDNDILGLKSLGLDGATLGTLTLTVPLTVTDYNFTFPSTAGSNGQVLVTDGSGTTSWATVNTSTADGNSLDAPDGSPTNALLVDNDGSIGVNTSSPDASSILEITSNTKGFLGPRMTTTERDAIASPATGLQIYNTTTSAINFYDGSSWKALGVAGSGVTSISSGTGLTGGPITSTGTISIATGGVSTTELATDAVTTIKITDANVTAAKLASDSVTTVKILDANVTTAKLADDSVTAAKLAAGAIDTTAIADNSVTSAKIIDGEIVNADISSTAAISYSKLSIADSDLTIAKTSGLQTVLDAKLPLTGGTMSGDITMGSNDILGISTLALSGSSSGTLTLSPAAAITDYTLTLPSTAGSNGQVLTTNGSGTTSWVTPPTGFSSSGVTGSIQFSDGSSGFSSDATNFFWDDTNERLGIGTNSPDKAITIAQTADDHGIKIIGFDDRSGRDASISLDSSGYLVIDSDIKTYLKAGGLNALTVDNSQNVGIGTTLPNEKLSVQGVTSLGETTAPSATTGFGKLYVKSSDSKLYFMDDSGSETDLTSGGGASSSGASGSLQFSDGSGGLSADATNLFWDNTNDRLGIGTASPSTSLHVTGDVSANDYLYTSDGNYKKDIRQIEDALSKVKKINGVRYYWRQDEFPEKKFSNEEQIGLIAQNVEKVFPELVKTHSNGYKSVRYANLVAVLIEAVKEQEKKNQQLEQRLLKIEKYLESQHE